MGATWSKEATRRADGVKELWNFAVRECRGGLSGGGSEAWGLADMGSSKVWEEGWRRMGLEG